MKAILLLEVETNVPLEMLRQRENVFIEVASNGNVWRPQVVQVQAMEMISPQEEALKEGAERALTSYPTNMGMHMGMSMVGEGD